MSYNNLPALLLSFFCFCATLGRSQTEPYMQLSQSIVSDAMELSQYGPCVSKRAEWERRWDYDLDNSIYGSEIILPHQQLNLGYGPIDSLAINYSAAAVYDSKYEILTGPLKFSDYGNTFNGFRFSVKYASSSDILRCETDTSITLVYKDVDLVNWNDKSTGVRASIETINFTLSYTTSGIVTTCYGDIILDKNPFEVQDQGLYYSVRYDGDPVVDTFNLNVLPYRANQDSLFIVQEWQPKVYTLYRTAGLDDQLKATSIPVSNTCLSLSKSAAPNSIDSPVEEYKQLLVKSSTRELLVTWVNSQSTTSPAVFELLDLQGKLLDIAPLGQAFSLSNVSSGMYVVRARDAYGAWVAKRIMIVK